MWLSVGVVAQWPSPNLGPTVPSFAELQPPAIGPSCNPSSPITLSIGHRCAVIQWPLWTYCHGIPLFVPGHFYQLVFQCSCPWFRDALQHPYISTCFCGKRFYYPPCHINTSYVQACTEAMNTCLKYVWEFLWHPMCQVSRVHISPEWLLAWIQAC